jgi:hypothetical protein
VFICSCLNFCFYVFCFFLFCCFFFLFFSLSESSAKAHLVVDPVGAQGVPLQAVGPVTMTREGPLAVAHLKESSKTWVANRKGGIHR